MSAIHAMGDLILVALGISICLVGGGLAIARYHSRFCERARKELDAIYSEVQTLQSDVGGLNGQIVKVEFVTFHGLLVGVVQTRHASEVPLPIAEHLLDRLNRFNFRWGLFAFGGTVLVLLGYLRYRAMKRKLRKLVST